MEIAEVLRMMLNWKAPGRDQIANFWLQQLAAAAAHTITNLFQQTDGRRSYTGLSNNRCNNTHSKE